MAVNRSFHGNELVMATVVSVSCEPDRFHGRFQLDTVLVCLSDYNYMDAG